MSELELPAILDIPDKLVLIIDNLNNYRYFLIEGGRNSTKSHTVARLLTYLAEQQDLRIVCGREVQKSIESSVHALFSDLIKQYNLFFDVLKTTITHKGTGSRIIFVGLREQGIDNVKSLEGCDIFWGEEAHVFTKRTVEILLPTIRKPKAKLFFTLNRYIRNDPIFETLAHRDDCLHIHINYDDVETRFITPNVIKEAEECKERNPKEFLHTWKGQPLTTTTEYLFNFDKLEKAKTIEPFGEPLKKQRVMGVDFASGGGDLCVASLIERTSNIHWRLVNQIPWDNPDTDESVGKVIALYGEWCPDMLICDAGGLGYPMFVSISKTIKNIVGFDGCSTDKCTDPFAGNNRYQAYLDTKTWVDHEWLHIKSEYTIKEFETIKKVYQKSGKMLIMSKIDQKKENVQSQDRADSVAMAVHGAIHYLGKADFDNVDKPIGMRNIKRVNKRKKIT